MSARRIDVREVAPHEYPGRWRKALERLKAMDDALQAGLLDPAAILAVHAVIAACDAFTIRHLGKQSASGNHFDVTDLITRVKNVQGLAEAARHPRRLLQEKGSIEYSDRYPRREEAERLAEHARRFVGFVEKNLE